MVSLFPSRASLFKEMPFELDWNDNREPALQKPRERTFQAERKTKTLKRLPYDPAIPLLGIHTQ